MAAGQTGYWGIDLGQCALKAIRLEVRDGKPVATAFEYIEHPKILSQPDADPDELTREVLTQFLSRNSIRGDVVAISVPGQSGLARFVKLPPVDQKKVADIVKFEAKQQIPFPLDEVVWDYQPLSTGEIVDGLALETEIGLFAMKRDMVYRAIQQFRQVNMEAHLVQMAPLALCNFVSYDLLGKDTSGTGTGQPADHTCIVALEIGTDNSNLVITDGGRIIWQRPIPIGGNHFTRALTKEMKLTFAKAEHLKRNAAKSPDLRKILSVLKQVLNDFVGEVQRSLGYFTNTHRNAQIQYMVGLGNAFRLPGLQKFLQEKLQMEVRKFQHLERTTGDAVTTAPTFAENIMSFGVAYGLALQGAKLTRLQTNLLPQEIRTERIIRGKKPWAVAAAASLLFGLSLIAFASGIEKRAVFSKDIEEADKQVKEVAKKAASYKSEFQSEEDKVKSSIDILNRIGAGVSERFNWQLLHQYVNLAMPQPNGDRLVEKSARFDRVKDKYWTKDDDAKRAYIELENMRFAKNENPGSKDAIDRDNYIKKHLIQINLIGINALYCDNLVNYFRKIHFDGNKLHGMSDDEKTQIIDAIAARAGDSKLGAVPKQGWVVELRGYTFHKGGSEFVEHTIVENLKNLKELKDPAYTDELKRQVEEQVGYLNIYKSFQVKNPTPGQFQLITKHYLNVLVAGMQGNIHGPMGGGPMGGGIMGGGIMGGGIMGGGPMAAPMAPKDGPMMANPIPGPMGAGPMMMMAIQADRSGWRPLGQVASSALAGGAFGPMMFQGGPFGPMMFQGGPFGPMMPPAGPFGPMMNPNPLGYPMGGPFGPMQPIRGPIDPKEANKPAAVTRTEFVLLFVWREPITTSAPTAGPAGGPFAPMGPMGPMNIMPPPVAPKS